MVRLPYLQAIVGCKIAYASRSQNAPYLAQNSPGVRDVLINMSPNDHVKHAISESQTHAVDKGKIQVCLFKKISQNGKHRMRLPLSYVKRIGSFWINFGEMALIFLLIHYLPCYYGS